MGSSAGPTSHGSEQWWPVVYNLPPHLRDSFMGMNSWARGYMVHYGVGRPSDVGSPGSAPRAPLGSYILEVLRRLWRPLGKGSSFMSPSPSGLSRYYQASSPGYSLGVVQVLVDGEGILCLRFISKVAVVLAQEIGLLGGIGSALGLHILWRLPLL